MDSRLSDFASDVLSAGSPMAVWSLAQDFFAQFGACGLIYGRDDGVHGEGLVCAYASDSLSGWQADYAAHGDRRHDPLFSYLPHMPRTYFTGVDHLSDYPFLTREEVAVVERAADHGFGSGLAMPMEMQSGGERSAGGWNLVSDQPRAPFEAATRENMDMIYTAAVLAHQSIQLGSSETPTVHLTPRERECLLWLAAGLRNEQIGHRMGIKTVTVDLHLRNLRTRLGASTREQALAIAIRSGALDP